MNSLDSVLLFLIIDLVAEKGTILYNDQIWDKVKNEFRDYEFEDKSYSYYSEDYGLISKTKITNICETKFWGKQNKDRERGRGLIFNQETLNKLSANYSIIEGIKITIKVIRDHLLEERDTCDGCDTFTECTDKNNDNNTTENSNNVRDMTRDQEKIIP